MGTGLPSDVLGLLDYNGETTNIDIDYTYNMYCIYIKSVAETVTVILVIDR